MLISLTKQFKECTNICFTLEIWARRLTRDLGTDVDCCLRANKGANYRCQEKNNVLRSREELHLRSGFRNKGQSMQNYKLFC